MSSELIQPATKDGDAGAIRRAAADVPTCATDECPRPDAVPAAIITPDDGRTADDYTAIRAAALAMSGAAPDTAPDDGLSPAGAAEERPSCPAAQPYTAAGAGETEQNAPAEIVSVVRDESPDVAAAQAAECASAGQADIPPASSAEAAHGSEGADRPESASPAVPAADGHGGGQPPAQPPAADEETPNPDEKPMSLLDHLNEMRWRLVRCFIAAAVGFCLCWAFVEPIFALLVKPLLAVLPAGGNAMYSTMPEAFFIRMFVACIAGLFVASPVIFYQIWAFISPGLYEEEKLFIVPVAVVSAVFFVGGALFCYHIVFPFAFQFFMSYNTEQIRVMPRISDYVDFVLKLLIAFGLIFEMPLFAFFLSRMGVLTAAMMRQARRYAILGIFIVAAILTPPDVLSQLLMAAPMLVLYEVSVIVAAVFGKKKKTPAAEEDGESAADPTPDAPVTGERS